MWFDFHMTSSTASAALTYAVWYVGGGLSGRQYGTFVRMATRLAADNGVSVEYQIDALVEEARNIVEAR